MNEPSRHLIIMRHAQAEAVAPSDHERPLTQRGLAAAAQIGRWLAEQGVVPDRALVSAALRTRQTWAEVAEESGWALEPVVEPALYSAGAENAMDLMRLTSPDAQCLIVLGHNPTVSYLAQLISDGRGDSDLELQMTLGFPPTASAIFQVSVPWSSFSFGDGRLVGFHAATH